MAILKREPADKLVLLNGRTWNEVVDRLEGIKSSGSLTGTSNLQSPIGGVVQVWNESGQAFEQGALVQVGDPVSVPGEFEGDSLFLHGHLFNAEVADKDTKTVGVAYKDIAETSFGEVVISGPATALVDVSDLSHEYAQPAASGNLESTANATGIRLIFANQVGNAELCKVLMVGGGSKVGDTFAVALEHVGGEDGTATAPASWSYRVRLYNSDPILQGEVDPGVAPHEYRRGLGQRSKATSGIATYDILGNLVILTTNETIVFSTCPPPSP